MKKFKALQTKRHLILNKNIIGIDPGKHKHQAAVLSAHGMLLGQPFTFKQHYWGFHKILWKKLTKLLPFCNTENTVFAIESSCNLWQKLAYFLDSKDYQVVLVSPLVTHLLSSRGSASAINDQNNDIICILFQSEPCS